MKAWVLEHRVRSMAVLGLVAAGAALVSSLQSGPARLAAFLLTFALCAGVVGLGLARHSQLRATAGAERDEVATRRDLVADQRDREAVHRDQAGEHRDVAADNRDSHADRRDQDADQRDHDADQRAHIRAPLGVVPLELPVGDGLAHVGPTDKEYRTSRKRARHDRGTGVSDRANAGLDRDAALADRGASASERTEAEHDRDAASADRGASAKERELAFIDELTGVYQRGAGSVELARECARARRTRRPLVLAFIDVDHLKMVNDSRGHAAGDRMLREVAHTLMSSLRPYDLVIRFGGDEFVCALPGLDLPGAAQRLGLLNSTLAAGAEQGSVTVGLAQLQPGDSVDALVARADAALIAERKVQRGTRAAPGPLPGG
ncbi:MAG: diguanylate cyclase [Cellulomonas sp.]